MGGAGLPVLAIKEFNGYFELISFGIFSGPGYEIPKDDAGNNMLTNTKDGYFSITEFEVW